MPTDKQLLARAYQKKKSEDDLNEGLRAFKPGQAAVDVAKSGLGSAAIGTAIPLSLGVTQMVTRPGTDQVNDILSKLVSKEDRAKIPDALLGSTFKARLAKNIEEKVKVPASQANEMAEAIMKARQSGGQWAKGTEAERKALRFVVGESLSPALGRYAKTLAIPAGVFGTVGALSKLVSQHKTRKKLEETRRQMKKEGAVRDVWDPLDESFFNEIEKIAIRLGSASTLEARLAAAKMKSVGAAVKPKTYSVGMGGTVKDMSPGWATGDEAQRSTRGMLR